MVGCRLRVCAASSSLGVRVLNPTPKTLRFNLPLLMCTLPQGNPPSRRAEGIKKKTYKGQKKKQAV